MLRRQLLLAAFAGKKLEDDWCAADGGEFPYESWRVEDGILRSVGGLETFQDIKTRRQYWDFEFAFEWKMLVPGNSGVKYQLERWDSWVPKGAKGRHVRARGPEMQLGEEAGTADARKQCGALYGKIAAERAAVVRWGEFNSGMLRKKGLEVEHWINGMRLVSYRLEADKESAIALQNHRCDVWFRGLQVRELG
jgi:hypothetical protein